MSPSNYSFTNPFTRETASGSLVFQRDSGAAVPNQVPMFQFLDNADDGLHTPCQDVPMPMPSTCRPGAGMLPGKNEWTAGYRWKDASMMFGAERGTWSREDETYFDPTHPKEMALGFSRKDIEYTELCEKNNMETFKNMGSREKRLLKALECGRLFRLSKLKLEKE